MLDSMIIKDISSAEKSQELESLLAADHVALGEQLRSILASLNEGDATAAFASLDLFWARLAMHIRAENLHLFPAILTALGSRPGGGADAPSLDEARETIARLRDDHDYFMHELARAIKTMRDLQVELQSHESARLISEVRERVLCVRARLERHNMIEEGVAYHWPRLLLDAPAQARLADKIRREIGNLPPRFRE